MTDEFWVNFERQFVDADEVRDSVIVPGPNSAATADPDVPTIEKEKDIYPIFIIPSVMGSLFPLAKEKVVSALSANG